jgi:excisionase family DNA binding protein
MKGMAALLTVRDVANEFGVSVRTVLGFIRRGELRSIHGLGRGLGYRIKREWVDEFLRARETASQGAQPPGGGPSSVSDRPTGDRKASARPEAVTPFASVRAARVGLGLHAVRNK